MKRSVELNQDLTFIKLQTVSLLVKTLIMLNRRRSRSLDDCRETVILDSEGKI
jgi:hypothetical protein